MKQAETERERMQQFYRDLTMLEPFLIGSKTMEEDAERLAHSIGKSLPICQLMLVRLTTHGTLKDMAFWGGERGYGHDVCRNNMAERHLPALIRRVNRGMIPTDGELEEIMVSTLGSAPLRFHPTMAVIRYQNQVHGFTLFGKPEADGPWSVQEKEVLTSLVNVIGITFANKNYHEDSTLQSWVLSAVMDNMNANLYVTDIHTDRILYMNKAMKQTFGVEEPEGKICWQVLQKGMSRRCDFCPVNILMERQKSSASTASYLWEERNTLTGRIYENYDSLMHWTDGSLVHFQQSMDITDSKMLARAANTDDLTDMLNRRAGRHALSSSLARAQKDGTTVTICMYDINELKEVNDAYGHAEGDILLRTIASAVKQVLAKDDYPFRLSGDEFIVVFEHTEEREALKKINEVRALLAQTQTAQEKPYEIGFCCGLLEIPPHNTLAIADILTKVDEKMYEQKRLFHIQKAEKKLMEAQASTVASSCFSYDKEHLYDALVQSTDDYIYICNMKTNTFRYPKTMVEEFDLPGEIIPNAAAVWGAKVHPHDKQAFLESNQEISDGRTCCHNVEYRAKNRKGEWVWMRCRGHLELDEKGEPSLFAGMITNLGKKNKIDHVTGLFNRLEFEEEVRTLLRTRPNHSVGLMVLGIDDFKHINDLYNREFGDEVLRAVSQKIQTLLPPSASIYRLDGDEFGVIARDTNKKEMQRLFDSVQSAFSHQQEYGGKKYYCTLSAGCTLFPQDGRRYSNLRKYAGYSLEYAKSNGKNKLVFFSKKILSHKARLLDLTERLRESVEHGFEGFELYYQMQVNARDGTLKGAEALARWNCKKYGNVRPDEFIPILEESSLIFPVGKWIFKTAVEACARWAPFHPGFTMSINLSYLQLTEPDFIPFMKQTIEAAGVEPSRIIAELTESCIASNISMLQHILEEIRRLGVRIAMDDFGTGYPSLGILKNAPVDIVKIDRAFVKGIENNTFDATFIKFIVELCHDVTIEVCLEGVETAQEYEIVRAMRLDFIQGFLFGRPEPEACFEQQHFRSRECSHGMIQKK